MTESDEIQTTEPGLPAANEVAPGMERRKLVWAVVSAAIVVYLIALPIRIVYYKYDFINMKLNEIRPWIPVRRIWWEQIKDLPTFGSKLLVQIVFGASMLVLVASVLLGLWLILTQEEPELTGERADAG